MINESHGEQSMPRQSLYRAIYRDSDLVEQNLDLLAVSMSRATLTARELIPVTAELVRVFHNPEW